MIKGVAINEESIYRQFIRIISSKEGITGRKCVKTIHRNEIQAKIFGKYFRVTTSFSF